MKILTKESGNNETFIRINRYLRIADIIAFIGFFLNITIVQLLKLLFSIKFYILLAKIFLITLPLMQAIFVLLLSDQILPKGLYSKFAILGTTFFYMIVVFIFYYLNIDFKEWLIGDFSYNSILLSLIILITLGLLKIDTGDRIIALYYLVDTKLNRYMTGGIILYNKKTGGSSIIGVNNINGRLPAPNKSLERNI